MSFKQLFTSIALTIGVFAPYSLNAQTLDAVDRGWYRDNPTTGAVESNPGSQNYLVGRGVISPGVAGPYRNFFAFDLTAFAGQSFSSATLSLYNPKFGDPFNNNLASNPNQFGGFNQFNPSLNAQPYETFNLFEVTTNATDILAGTAGRSGYNDLGDGLNFGSYNATLADNGSFIQIVLNADGLTALNNAVGGVFVLGGRLSTVDPGAGTQTVFGFSNDNNLANTQLSLVTAVPEPETLALMLMGLGFVGAVVRRKANR